MLEMIVSMMVAVALMCAVSLAFWFLENKTAFGNTKKWTRQIVIGVFFGVAAALSTHFGVEYDRMVLNVRDMAPLSAGLFFYPWAGVIAGIIGGVHRFIAGTYFDIGAYSTFACTLSTILAGFVAAASRKYFFEGKKPSPFYAFYMGAVMEVFHMLVLLLSHMRDITTAFNIVQICALPMIIFTAIGLAISSIVLSAASGNKYFRIKRQDKAEKPISSVFQWWVVVVVSGMMLFTFVFTYIAQTQLVKESALAVLDTDNKDMQREILFRTRNIFVYETALMEILVFSIIVGLIYVLVRHIILKNLDKINESLSKITGGNLNERVNVRDSVEFVSLSEDINSTVDTLKRYIKEAENRINEELRLAKEIQRSALPSVFPPFPEKDEFQIFAGMEPAKDVGGDFYDFFLVDENHLAIVIADVSGKGIPAALFMMKSKAVIRSLAESGLSPKEVFETANAKICEGNDAEMFVTAWLGIIDINTGEMKCVNAGHEYPAIKRHGSSNAEGKDSAYELFQDKHGFVLGGMEGVKYKEYSLNLEPGDRIFLYTDGVTEATSAANELFGTDRLIDALNGPGKQNSEEQTPKETLAHVVDSIRAFVKEAPQFDDITMVSFWMNERATAKCLKLPADAEAASKASDFAEEYFSAQDVPMKVVMKLNIAIDEIVSNIVNYSGATEIEVCCLACEGKVSICFKDDGIPYNPLAKADPDITKDAEEREIGGLGIFMVKKSMDHVKYENHEGLNILTIEKTL